MKSTIDSIPQTIPHQHQMLAEIHQQPAAIAATLARYTVDRSLRTDLWKPILDAFGSRSQIVIAASGTSRHAGLVGEILLEELAGIAVDVEYASEYILQHPSANPGAAVLVLSQSGETADTLAALAEASRRRAATFAITNVAGSSMSQLADAHLLTAAGPELAIAATKSFTTQLTVLYLMALALGQHRSHLTAAEVAQHLSALHTLPGLIEHSLAGWQSSAEDAAKHLREARSFLFLGRGLSYPIAREAALKLKEVSYIPSEAYPTGELKHGPNALLGAGAPVVVLAAADPATPNSVARYAKTLRLLEDIKPQHPHVLAVGLEHDPDLLPLATDVLSIPSLRSSRCSSSLTGWPSTAASTSTGRATSSSLSVSSSIPSAKRLSAATRTPPHPFQVIHEAVRASSRRPRP